jgi:UDP-N-acetylglucosamine acyltransferase
MSGNEVFIHSTATVHPKARLDSGVWIGPYSFIGEKVTIHKDTRIDAHVCADGLAEIGESCRFFAFSSIGTEPQDVDYQGEETLVKIGDRNIFREFMTVNRGTVKGGGKTVIGNDNYFMAYSHVGHDCLVGNETVFINAATLAGHVTVDDCATVGAFSGVHQFCRVGRHAFIGGYSVIVQDVLPFCRVAGARPTHIYGLNAIGLRRKGFKRERLKALQEMFRIIFYSDLNTSQALEKIKKEMPASKDRDEIISFIRASERGLIKKTAEKWEEESG